MAKSSLQKLDSKGNFEEFIKFYNSNKKDKGKLVQARVKIVSFLDGKFFIHYIPSLGISSYGETDQISLGMLKESLDSLFDKLINLKKDMRDSQMSQLGWNNQVFESKKYTSSYVDKTGILLEFNLPEETVFEENFFEVA